MTERRVGEITDVLRRVTSGTGRGEIEQDAEELMRTITPRELSLAEQELLEEGIEPEELGHLCEVHLRALSDEIKGFRAELPAGQPVDTLMAEHEVILEALQELEKVNEDVQQADALRDEHAERLEHIATHLVEAELHHQREEEALFPQVEQRGVTGPPRTMRLEHDDLRPRKHELLELGQRSDSMPFADFKERLNDLTTYLVFNLRDHIFKEDNILYPAAVEVVTDPTVWDRVKAQCDEIGYSCFTPEAEKAVPAP
ncbi:MAG: DUF438 domain-containing protein [Anaerolineae bacterium]|jgi:DUF438 domain-containing protein